jgi:hypothetical protein
MGKVFKKITKPIQKLIPKELKPFAPFIAAALGPVGGFQFLSALGPTAQAAISKGLISAGTSAALGEDTKSALRSGILAAAPTVIGKGLEVAGANIPYGEAGSFGETISKGLTGAGERLSNPNPSLMDAAKIVGAQGSIEGAVKLKEINEDELRRYNEQLRERGITDKIGRRKGIYDIYASIEDEGDDGTYRVYSDEYINSILDKYGYKNGGRIGFEAGGEVAALAEEVKRLQSENAELKSKSGLRETREGIDFATKGFEQAFGSPLMGQMPSPQRIVPGFGLMNGGRVGFEMGGDVSPTDSDEEGMGGVIYYDEEGKPISQKKQWNILIDKQKKNIDKKIIKLWVEL